MAGIDVDALLKKKGLRYQDLSPEEQETLNSWLSALDRGQISVPVVREFVTKLKDQATETLSDMDDTPNDWLTVLCFLIPLVGIIRKWYIDQKKLLLVARIRNYVLLEAFLSSPEKAKRAIEKAINSMPAK